jgi:hypothetical protein
MRAEQGSVLLGALVLVFVMTLLGLALFDTALLDSELARASVDEYRALESAQTGLERAMHRLYRDLCEPDPACANPAPGSAWLDGAIDGTPLPITTSAFVGFIPATTAFSGSFTDPRATEPGVGFPTEEYAGTYTVELKHLTQAEATDAGFTYANGAKANLAARCGEPGNPNLVCPDLLFVRARGTFGTPSQQVATRVIQALVQAEAPGSEAMLAERVAGGFELHGSLHLVSCASPPCAAPTLGAVGSGIRNNYNGLAPALQSLVPRLPVVTCPPGTACAGQPVETLSAIVRIGKAPNDATPSINLQAAGASIGESGAGTVNAATGNRGKPTMDGVYVGAGCAAEGVAPPCSDAVATNPAQVYTDSPIRGYDLAPQPRLARLDDPVSIAGVQRADYAACSGPGVCNPSGAAVSGAGADFFVSHAFQIVPATLEDQPPPICDPTSGLIRGGGNSPCVRRDLHRLLTGNLGPPPDDQPWADTTATFRKTFRCDVGPPSGPLLSCDAGGVRVSGSVRGPTVPLGLQSPVALQIEWRGPDWFPHYLGSVSDAEENTLVVFACGDTACTTRQPLAPGNPDADVVYPLLLYVDGPLKICVGGCANPVQFLGHAAILARGNPADTATNTNTNVGSIVIGSTLLVQAVPPIHTSFPQRSLLTLYTPGNIFLGSTGPVDVMARLHAGSRIVTTQKINFIGAATAATFDLGTQVPRFWAVRMPLTPTALPSLGPQAQPPRSSPRLHVTTLRWKDCSGTVTDQPC